MPRCGAPARVTGTRLYKARLHLQTMEVALLSRRWLFEHGQGTEESVRTAERLLDEARAAVERLENPSA